MQFFGGYPTGGGAQNTLVNITTIAGNFDPTDELDLVFNINTGSNTVFNGLSFTASDDVIFSRSTLTVTDCIFYDNSLVNTGTDYIIRFFEDGISGNFTNCQFLNNDAIAIFGNQMLQNVAITDCTFTGNTGPAIITFNDNDIANVSITNSLFTANTIDNDAITIRSQTSSITNCRFQNNDYGNGGAIDHNGVGSTMTIADTDFLQNAAGNIGAMTLRDNTTNITNCNFIENIATSAISYGVMELNDSDVNITDCLFRRNQAIGSINRGVLEANTNSNVVIDNSQFIENSATGSITDGCIILWSGSSLIMRNSLMDGNSGGSRSNAITGIGFSFIELENSTIRNHDDTTMRFRTNLTDGHVSITGSTFEKNPGFNTIDADDFLTFEIDNTSFLDDSFVSLNDITNSTITNSKFIGNSNNTLFMDFRDSPSIVDNSLFSSEVVGGNHRLINSNGSEVVTIRNSTLSSSDFVTNNVHVRNQGNNANSMIIENSVIWSGKDNVIESGINGDPITFQRSNSLIKGENDTTNGNLDGTTLINAPLFEDPSLHNFREEECSPTINAGNNTFTTVGADIDGNPRVFETTINIGAYEFQLPKSTTCNFIDGLPNCTTLTVPLNNDVDVPIGTDLSWNADPFAIGYLLSVGTTTGGTDILNAVDVGNVTTYNLPADLPPNTIIYVTVIPYNLLCPAMGCIEESFTTEDLGITPCTTLNSPLNADIDIAINTDITWNAAAYANGYFISLGTTPGGTDILNNQDVGNTTTYNPPADLPNGTIIYVNIIPYGPSGNAIGCTEESFTTIQTPVAPNCTTLTLPINGETNVAVDTDISWTAIPNADGYQISIGTAPVGTNIINNLDVGNVTTYNLPTDLPEDATIIVSIIPYNLYGNATACIQDSFITETSTVIPLCTNLTTPVDGDTNVTVTTDVDWIAIANADGYILTVGTTAGGTDIVNALDVGNVTSYNFPTDLPDETTIFVTITPYNTAGNALVCTEESFTTETIIPLCTNLTTPVDGATNVAITTDLDWTAIANADGYILTVGTTAGGNDIVNAQDVGNVTTYNFPADLPDETIIFVSITPYNTAGNALACTEESFTTETIIPLCTYC